MTIWRNRICDICNKPTNDFEGSLIIKQRWALGWEAGWTRLDICPDCAAELRVTLQEKLEAKNGVL